MSTHFIVEITAHPDNGGPYRVIRQRIDPRCVSYTVSPNRITTDHIPDCLCGVEPLEEARVDSAPEDQEDRGDHAEHGRSGRPRDL